MGSWVYFPVTDELELGDWFVAPVLSIDSNNRESEAVDWLDCDVSVGWTTIRIKQKK